MPVFDKPQTLPVYVASRASVPERVAMWRALRDERGVDITSSWIDEAGEGKTHDFTELWARIQDEMARSAALILYATPEDFPLKGALVEAGMALMWGLPVYLVLPGVMLEERSKRPIGSWVCHPACFIMNSIDEVLAELRPTK